MTHLLCLGKKLIESPKAPLVGFWGYGYIKEGKLEGYTWKDKNLPFLQAIHAVHS